MKLYIKNILVLFCFAIVLGGCNLNKFEIAKDEDIDPQIKSSIDSLNQIIVDAAATEMPAMILPIESEQLAAQVKSNDLELFMLKMKGAFDTTKYVIRNQFHVTNSKNFANTSVYSGLKGAHDYNIVFKAMSRQSVVTVAEFTDSFQTISLLTIFGKYGNAWKLNILRFDVVKILGMDAIDWYQKSRADYKAGDLIDAADEFTMASRIAKPGDVHWRYQLEKEIKVFGDSLNKVITKAFVFPLTCATGTTNVTVFRVVPEVVREGCYPDIYYITNLPFEDTSSLSKECDLLHRQIGSVFDGITRKNNTIVYRAFHKVPSGGNERSFGFVRKVIH